MDDLILKSFRLGHGNIVVGKRDPCILVKPELPPGHSRWYRRVIKTGDQERREDEVVVPDQDPQSNTGIEGLVKKGFLMDSHETTFHLECKGKPESVKIHRCVH